MQVVAGEQGCDGVGESVEMREETNSPKPKQKGNINTPFEGEIDEN